MIKATNEDDFQESYAELKKLYGLRSSIVHGQNAGKKNLSVKASEKIEVLRDYVRIGIRYAIKFNDSKEALFKHLNQVGFPQ